MGYGYTFDWNSPCTMSEWLQRSGAGGGEPHSAHKDIRGPVWAADGVGGARGRVCQKR